MQQCPNCQSRQLDGTLFCSDCGASLIKATVPVTKQRSEIPPMPNTVTPVEVQESRLGLYITSSGRQLRFRQIQQLLIGRKDAARGVLPEIDLSDDGGYEAGVSRRHAMIYWNDGRFYVEDLGSANGTFVNEQQVTANTRAPLAHGDALSCATLILRVEISP